jgi:hypothetical protein
VWFIWAGNLSHSSCFRGRKLRKILDFGNLLPNWDDRGGGGQRQGLYYQINTSWYANCLLVHVPGQRNKGRQDETKLIYPKTENMTSATAQETQNEILKSRIMELQSALFFTESSSIVKLPTHVISDVELDNEGQIWFVIPMPAMNLEAYDKEIPTKLDFFKKGKDFFVKVRGIAFLQTDLKEANANSGLSAEMKERMNDTDLILVKVKVLDTEMVDNTPKPSQNWLQASRSQLSSWFF